MKLKERILVLLFSLFWFVVMFWLFGSFWFFIIPGLGLTYVLIGGKMHA